MTDLRDRFRTLDALPAPSLWTEVQVRSVTAPRYTADFGLAVLVAAALALAVVGGVLLAGSARPLTTNHPVATQGTIRTSGAWLATSHLLESRIGHTATLLSDGRVLVAGGVNQAFGVGSAAAELYDPRTDGWTATGGMHAARAWHSATLLRDGTVLVVGGIAANNAKGTDVAVASAEIYDAATDVWTPIDGPLVGEVHGALLLPDGRVLVTGGYDERARRPVGQARLYDPATRTWSDVGGARFPAGASAAQLFDGRILVVLADASSRNDRTAFYDPETSAWSAGPDLPKGFGNGVWVRLADGRVLAAGGGDPNGPGAVGAAQAALFDPSTATWRLTGSMLVARLGHAATLMADGRVLVTGGKVYGGPEAARFASAELYDPILGTWTAIRDMAVARDGHTATLLPDGRVLVTGGEAQGGSALDSAELYRPGEP